MGSKAGQIIEHTAVDDPLMTDAEYIYRRRQEAIRAEALGRKPNGMIGKVVVEADMVALIGGFARFKDRTEHQVMAARRFRSLHERAQLGGARAIDYTAVKVDTSGPNDTLDFERGDDARKQYRSAIQRLGLQLGSLVENVVVYDKSIRLIARSYGYGENKAARKRLRAKVFYGVDILAVHFGFASRSALDRSDPNQP